jgi:peptidase E
MKLSGFDAVIKELIDSDIVYAWYDAGACIAGPDLNAYKWVELESLITYKHETIWKWLELTPWHLVGNIDSVHELSNEKSKKLMKYYDEKGLKYKKMKDWEVILHIVKK